MNFSYDFILILFSMIRLCDINRIDFMQFFKQIFKEKQKHEEKRTKIKFTNFVNFIRNTAQRLKLLRGITWQK